MAEPVGIIGCGVAAVSLLYSALRNSKTDHKEILDRLGESERRLERLETKMEVFWKTVGVTAANLLHSPHPENARRDYLIERYVELKLTDRELAEFRHILRALLVNPNAPDIERITAGQLLAALELQYPS